MLHSLTDLAAECGFELAGVAPALPATDAARYADWAARGLGGEMKYLADHRAALRNDPRELLASARSVISVGKYYGGPEPLTREQPDAARGWISRYAWGEDYHLVLRRGLEQLAARLAEAHGEFEWRACVDTAPLLERSYAAAAGLGWIGKNTCLISEQRGSWFFLGELLTSLDPEQLAAPRAAPANRCGTCTRCIEACPTQAIVPHAKPGEWELDARRCISYFTIELRGDIPADARPALGEHVFGCDICQDVCPWNQRASRREVNQSAPEFRPGDAAGVTLENPPLEALARLTEAEFRAAFRYSPILRTKHAGFLRNVAIAMGNSHNPAFTQALTQLAEHENTVVADHARWALERLTDGHARQY